MTSNRVKPYSIRLLGAVICGGRSTRMGRDKSLLMHDSGVTYLEHTTIRLSQCCSKVIHCVAHDESSGHPLIPLVPDRAPDRGPAEAISGALRFAAEHQLDGCLVNAVDLPNLNATDLEKLIDQFDACPSSIIVATAPDGRLQPLVAIYPVHLRGEIDQLASETDRSITRYFMRLSSQNIGVQKVILPDDALRNVNTPGDLTA